MSFRCVGSLSMLVRDDACMTERTLRGHWWRPEDDQTRQPGTLRISNSGELTLDLIGGFDLEIRRPLADQYAEAPGIVRRS